MLKFSYTAAAWVLLACLPVSYAGAQESSPAQEEAAPTIKVDVSVVSLPVSVRDAKGRLISNLSKEDFEIREDGKPQEILYFSRETTLPLTLGLLVDSSVSQGRLIGAEQKAGGEFLEQMIKPHDAAFLISFDTEVDLLQDVTGSVKLLRSALDSIRGMAPPAPVTNSSTSPFPQGPFPGPSPPTSGPFPSSGGGGTHLYDAVYLAANEVLQKEAGRKAIILITDGEDQGSRISRDAAIEYAQRNDVAIYGILFVDREFYGFGGYSGESVLSKMAGETGGRTFRAGSDKELADAFQQISDELRSQYSLGYSPLNSEHDGGFRRVDVRVQQRGFRVQARKGYYAPLDAHPPRQAPAKH